MGTTTIRGGMRIVAMMLYAVIDVDIIKVALL